MADSDEVFRILMQVEGEEKLSDASAKLALAEQKLQALNAAARAAGGSMGTQSAAMQAAAGAVLKYRTELDLAEKSLAKLGGGGKGRNSGMALMEISRAAEDAQYGLNGVLNNLPGLVMSLGGSAGLVGVVSLLAVGGYQLYKHWNDLATVFGGGHAKTAAEEMEELRKKTSLTADEAERLARVDKVDAAVKENRAATTKEEKATNSAVADVISEAGIQDVVAGMIRARPDLVDSQGTVPAALKELKEAQFNEATSPQFDEARGRRIEAEKKLNDAKIATAEKIVATGQISDLFPGGLDQLIESVQKDPSAFGPKAGQLLGGLKAATPEAREQADYEASEAARQGIDNDRQFKLEEMQRKAREHAADEQAKDSGKDWDDALKEAKKSRSFVGKSAETMTPAELLAKQEHDQSEVKVADAAASQSWLGKDAESLTPEEKIAKKRSDDKDKAENKIQTDMQKATGVDDYVKEAIMGGVGGGDIKAMLKGMGFNAESQSELLRAGTNDVAGQKLKEFTDSKSTTLQGGRSLADAIQGGVTNKGTPEAQLAAQMTANTILMQMSSDIRDNKGAIAG